MGSSKACLRLLVVAGGLMIILVLAVLSGWGGRLWRAVEGARAGDRLASLGETTPEGAAESSLSRNSEPPIWGVTARDEWGEGYARYLVADAGLSWVRTSISWAQHEPERGQRHLSDVDAHFKSFARLGLQPVVFVADNPAWASSSSCGPLDKAPLSAYADFVGALAERYDGDGDYDGDGVIDGPDLPRVDYWQAYNEPDNQWTTGTASTFDGCWGRAAVQYAQLLEATRRAIKKANPDGQFVFGIAGEQVTCPASWGCSGDVFNFNMDGGDFVDGVLDYMQAHPATYFDIFDFHFYPGFHARWDSYGPGIAGKAAYYRQRMQAKGVTRPLMCTETGRRSDKGQTVDGLAGSDEEQSRYLVKTYARALAAGLKAVLWFSLTDVSIPQEGGLAAWGLLDAQRQPKPSYYAFTTLTSQFDGAAFSSVLRVSGAEGYLFKLPGGGDRSIVWATGLPVSVSFAGLALHVTDVWGRERAVADGQVGDQDGVENGTVVLSVDASPLYVDSRPGAGTLYEQRVHAGGSTYTDASGEVWAADQAFSAGGWGHLGGTSYCVGAPIANTADPALYQCVRTWTVSATPGYRLGLPNGQYEVTLKFAELYWDASEKRRCSVRIEGLPVLEDYDIWVDAGGKNRAVDRVFYVMVSDGELTIDFTAVADAPQVNAIQVRQVPGPLPTAAQTATLRPIPSATATATGTATARPTSMAARTGTPRPTNTPMPTPALPAAAMPGHNVQCEQYAAAEMCASVSDAAPAQNASVTVYGRLTINGVAQANQAMKVTWRYRTITFYCSSTTGPTGLAQCKRNIGLATRGYVLNVDIAIAGYRATTWLTPW